MVVWSKAEGSYARKKTRENDQPWPLAPYFKFEINQKTFSLFFSRRRRPFLALLLRALQVRRTSPLLYRKKDLPATMSGLAMIDGERTTGQDVRTANVIAVMAIGNIVKSSLGPVGLDKVRPRLQILRCV